LQIANYRRIDQHQISFYANRLVTLLTAVVGCVQ